jgi:hypothetical protein
VNGYLAEQTVQSTAEIIPWLQEAIAHFYPESFLCSIAWFGCPRACSTSALPAAEGRRFCNLPPLRRTPCRAARHG